ncbi:MAG: ParB N-terminal domain-containing protein [Cyanobacteria bacterium J06607_13]
MTTPASVSTSAIGLSEWESQVLQVAEEQGCKIIEHCTPSDRLRLIVKALEVDASEVEPNPWNPNEMTERGNVATGESLQEFGRVSDIVCRCHPTEVGRFQIIDGEHRHRHFDGIVEINVVMGLTEAECKKLTIIMDSTRGELSTILSAQLLAEIQDELGGLLRLGLPWTEDELDERIRLADVDWSQFDEGDLDDDGSEGGSDPDDEWRHVHASLSDQAYDVLMQARGLIADQCSLHERKDIAWGQVLEMLAAEYLNMPGR